MKAKFANICKRIIQTKKYFIKMAKTLDPIKNNEYISTFNNVPALLSLKRSEILINKNTFSINEKDLVKTEKLKANSYGDWDLSVLLVHSRFIESKEILDNMLIDEEYRDPPIPSVNYEKISFEEAMRIVQVEISCNMDYYSKNKDELEKDLNRNVNEGENMKYVEQELFYKQIFGIFGGIEDDDDNVKENSGDTLIYPKSFILKDFNLLSHDGNYIYATAKRGEFYVLFCYVN